MQIAAVAIGNRCGASAQVAHLQIFERDHIIVAHQSEGRLVVKVAALPAHMLVLAGQQFDCLLAPVTALLPPRCWAFFSARAAFR
jgi:hypothetical protein